MVGYFLENGRNILWDLPVRPDDIRNVSFLDDHDGVYVFGQNIFSTRPFPITPIFRRNLTGNAEEFLLGVVSVLLIAVLSELVQAVLMHTRRARRPGREGVRMAFLVDEFYHFRNLWKHFFYRISSTSQNAERRRRFLTSVTILSIAMGLMAADVFAVYLTQPITTQSSDYQYNIRGVTPTFTHQGLGQFIRRLSRERPCVTPTFVQEDQTRGYTVSACTTYDIQKRHDDEKNFTGTITVGSWFHKAGSDHNVTFGDSSISIKARTVMYVSEGPAHRILYDVIEDDDMRLSKFLHELFIHSVLEVSCNRRIEGKGAFENTWCDEIIRLKSLEEQKIVDAPVIFWRRRDSEDESDIVRGLQSTYRVTLERPWTSVDNGISPLTSTSLLEEVEGAGQYVNITNEHFSDNLDGLLEEEGRVAGLLSLVLVFLIFAVALVILRVTLRPVSLGAMAWSARDKMSDTPSESDSKVLQIPQSNCTVASSIDSLTFECSVPSRGTTGGHDTAVDTVHAESGGQQEHRQTQYRETISDGGNTQTEDERV